MAAAKHNSVNSFIKKNTKRFGLVSFAIANGFMSFVKEGTTHSFKVKQMIHMNNLRPFRQEPYFAYGHFCQIAYGSLP